MQVVYSHTFFSSAVRAPFVGLMVPFAAGRTMGLFSTIFKAVQKAKWGAEKHSGPAKKKQQMLEMLSCTEIHL